MADPASPVQIRPPAYAVRELYDSFLRTALVRFFEDASLERDEPDPNAGEQRAEPRIESSRNRSVLTIHWLGWRYLLRVPLDRQFSTNEVRLARAIVLALAARYGAVLNPQVMAEKGDLFRGAIEDRFVGAFLDPRPYTPGARLGLADRIAPALDVLRVAAVSNYENRPISTGLLLLAGDQRTGGHGPARRATAPYWEVLTSARRMFRLANGVDSLFLVNEADIVVDVIDIARWAAPSDALSVPCAQAYVPHASATLGNPNVCVVLSPSHEMKVFAEGVQLFSFRNADWRLLDLDVRFRQWAVAVGSKALAERLFRTALDLADAREGALFVVLRDPLDSAPQLVAGCDRLDLDVGIDGDDALASRRQLLRLLAGRSVMELDPSVLCALAALDGAIVMDSAGVLLAAGAILRHPPEQDEDHPWIAEGARTTAAIAASRFGPVLKVSEDGVITFFDHRKIWEI